MGPSRTLGEHVFPVWEGNGALGRIRTPDPLIRSQVLYPAELPAREAVS